MPLSGYTAEELKSLSKAIASRPKPELERHIRVDKDEAFGSITWSKHLGRPKTGQLSDAFTILFSTYQYVRREENGSVHFDPLVVPVTLVEKWDNEEGPDDKYLVSFAAFGVGQKVLDGSPVDTEYWVDVQDALNVEWDPSKPHTILPSRRYFLKGQAAAIIDPFILLSAPGSIPNIR